jgi:Spy/CpxP family protein refolding chaperone
MVALSSVRAAVGDAATDAPAKKQRMTPEQRTTQMAEQLGLTDAQKASLKTAMEVQTKARTEQRNDSTFAALSQSEKQAKSKVISDAFAKTVKAFLTADQIIKFDALMTQQQKKGRKKSA